MHYFSNLVFSVPGLMILSVYILAIILVWVILTTILNHSVGKKFPSSTKQPQKFNKDPGFWLMAIPIGAILVCSVLIIVLAVVKKV
jgi:ABC-type thiamin/hydroxymethylpyrimidine transport system permease subunit